MPIGEYATLDGAKLRLGFTDVDATRDALLQTIVDQVNGELESFMGRVAAPIPYVTTTLTADAAAGDTTLTVASAAGASAGGSIMVGDLAGTHEAVDIDDVSGSVLTLGTALGAAYASGQAVQSVYYFNGADIIEDRRLRRGGREVIAGEGFVSGLRHLLLPVPFGFRSMALLELADYTGGPFTAVPADHRFNGPTNRDPGWPYSELWVANAQISTFLPYFRRGFRDIRAVLVPGWPAVPAELAGIANVMAVTYWQMRSSGGAYQTAIGTDGRVVGSQTLDAFHYNQLLRYQDHDYMVVIHG